MTADSGKSRRFTPMVGELRLADIFFVALLHRVARSLEILSRTFCFSTNRVDYFHGCPQRGKYAFPPSWKLGLGTKNVRKSEATSRFRLIDLFLAITLYLPVWHSHCTNASFTILVWFKNFKDNKTFSKDQGHNKFWQQIQGQFLALKGDWQPYV